MTQTPFDTWKSLREITSARIAIGRSGASLPTRELLDFQLAHARARDAVTAVCDHSALSQEFAALDWNVLQLASLAADRSEYLLRPDLGRQLDDASDQTLRQVPGISDGFDLVVVVADGLSAPAADRHSAPLLRRLLPRFQRDVWRIAPICVVKYGRVAIGDRIGALLRSRMTLILLGERPGLGAADSLGAYFVYDPDPKRTDAERNCVSNIRPDGLPVEQAAETLYYLMTAARTKRLTGVALKDDRGLTAIKVSHITEPKL